MSNKLLPSLKFDDFYLDMGERCLTFQGQPVPLTPKAFQTLVVLLRNHGKVVEKECFLKEVWADTFVEESTLSQNILTLRKTLSRFKKDQEFIVTVPRRGYQFVGDVQEVSGDEEMIAVGEQTPTDLIAGQHETHSHGLLASRSFSPWKVIFVSLLAVSAFAVGYFVSIGFEGRQSFAESQFSKFRVDTIVADADIRNSTISPNGKYLVLVQVKSGVQSLYLRQIENGNCVEVVPRINGTFIGAAFSPSSEQIFYSVNENLDSNKPAVSALYKVSVHGGASQEILRNIYSPAAVSPDNRSLAFIRRDRESKETAIVLTDIEGGNERILAVRKPESGFTNSGVSWSPNGKFLSATVFQRENNQPSIQVAVVDAETGEQRIVSRENWASAGQTL